MRDVPGSMTAALADGATTFAHVWRVTRADGVVLGFSDHDRPLSLDDLSCDPISAATLGAVEKSTALSVDTASLSGALSADAITEEDLRRGLWDGARVDIFRVDWRDTRVRVHLFAGNIGEVRRGVSAFEAELRGLQAPLNVPVGRVFSRFCDADLGDARCSKDISSSIFSGAGVVSEVLSQTSLRASGLSAYAEGWFARGKVVWSDGGSSEVAAHHNDGSLAVLELLDPAGDVLIAGAAFTIYAGCDKRIETCRAKFANTANFRGFPHMPGNDAIQSGPVPGDKLDGSSRLS
ncbi:MAG TPA: DUF2163 domain-containing protein [Vitreimonas sp.]|nr:DUF2163 domain-containing protein [Vitreimonas sp.]